MQQRQPGDAVTIVALLTAAPFAVILILFLTALLRCERKNIPAVMRALPAVLKALRRWSKG